MIICPIMDVSEIIDALGGVGCVASATGCAPNTIHYWVRRRRIPAAHAPALLDMAIAAGVERITAETLLAAAAGKDGQ